jgi:predicted DNA-binding antitoxin AbrB/MazE fold protein
MVYRGHVENGVIRLEDSVTLPEGAEVRVEIVPPGSGCRTETPVEDELAAIWADVPEAEWNRLPADLTENLDHYYIYGTPQ